MAITLGQTTYTEGDPIPVVSDEGGGPIVLYNLDNGDIPFSFGSYDAGFDVDYSGLAPGNYSIIELSTSVWGDSCKGTYPSLTYEECKSIDGFLNEFLFTINPLGGSAGDSITASSLPSLSPDVSIISPKDADLFSNNIPIKYQVVDRNDSDPVSKDWYGLNTTPVSIFYSDKFSDASQSLIFDVDRILVAKNLPAIGTYNWKWTDLVEGKIYKIIVSATDKDGKVGERLSGYFHIDTTPPTFTVTADPAVAKNENVTLKIKSSEELSSTPQVYVRQHGSKNIKVDVSLKDDFYVGTYKVLNGYDGTAVVEITASDLAGNSGSTIVGGGTFSVGINPPAKPIVTFPTENAKVTSDIISVTGTGRDDTDIIVTVNGVDTYKTKPDTKGSFVIKNVHLKKNIKNGLNTINIVAVDRTGSTSEAEFLNVLFNAPPVISFLKPVTNSILSGITTLSVKGVDDNGDLLHYLYEIAPVSLSRTGETDWKKITDVPNDNIYFDSTKFLDGQYLIRVSADDGLDSTSTEPVNVRIRNETSFFIRFYDGLNVNVNQKSATIRGVVYAEKNVSPLPIVKSIEYTVNGGKSWIAVPPEDGVFDSGEERFQAVLTNLKDGINNVSWRTTDSRGFKVVSDEPIIVDRLAPQQPKILFPANASTITKDNNDSSIKGKFTFTLRGQAEPGTTVNAEINGKKLIGRVSFDGTFRIVNIDLPKPGNYKIKAFTSDEASNNSPTVEYSFTYDNPPVVIFTNPSNGRGLSNKTELSWLTNDVDGDIVSNSVLSYHRIGGTFIELAKNLKENKFEWDTTKLQEGNNYELRLQTSDGLTSISTLTPFSIDRSSPTLSSFELKRNILKKGEVLEGKGQASDNSSGVEFVEYQFRPTNDPLQATSSSTWYKADIKKGHGDSSILFSIKNKLTIPDGDYLMVARAVDFANNISSEVSQNINIDSTPPHVGSFEVSSEDKKLLPEAGVWNTKAGTSIYITLSLENDTKNAYLIIGEKHINLIKDLSTGLWKGEFSFDQPGIVKVAISATDNSGNILSEKPLAVFNLVTTEVEKTTTSHHWWSWMFN